MTLGLHKHWLAAILRNLTGDPFNRLDLSKILSRQVKLTLIIVQAVGWKKPSKINGSQARHEISDGWSVLIVMIIK